MPKFVGEFVLPDLSPDFSCPYIESDLGILGRKVVCAEIPFLLSQQEVRAISTSIPDSSWVPVGISGILREYHEGDAVGSLRASAYSKWFADLLWNRLRASFQKARQFTEHAFTDWDGHARWRAVGVNPLMRFIRYEPGHRLIAHYDAPYIDSERQRTLMSLVIYLSRTLPPEAGGGTRMLLDEQQKLPHEARNYADWNRCGTDSEVLVRYSPDAGDALLFDHRLLHDGEPLTGTARKLIMRTDILFEKC